MYARQTETGERKISMETENNLYTTTQGNNIEKLDILKHRRGNEVVRSRIPGGGGGGERGIWKEGVFTIILMSEDQNGNVIGG